MDACSAQACIPALILSQNTASRKPGTSTAMHTQTPSHVLLIYPRTSLLATKHQVYPLVHGG